MLIRSIRSLVAVLGSFIFVTSCILLLRLYDGESIKRPNIDIDFLGVGGGRTPTPDFVSSHSSSQNRLPDESEDEADLNVYGRNVHEVFSVSTKKGKYFEIDFGDYNATNPSILAHPYDEDTWIVVAQQIARDIWNTVWCAELVCNAKFVNGVLKCIRSPLILPIAATISDHCEGDLFFLTWNVGPHDARAFYGPNGPFTIYGSQSHYNCFGLWVQDMRFLVDWGVVNTHPIDFDNPFRMQTEIQRPPPLGLVEKNWFLFWDSAGKMYAHYDIYPKRAFAELSPDGTAGPDLALAAADSDAKCMERYMPKLPPTLESIHQATNSLSITLCKQSDPGCKADETNTFIMTIFQHKTFHNWHGAYEPYVMLMQPNAPFAIHAISEKPIWIHGRTDLPRREDLNEGDVWEETEMFYVTSISWKAFGSKYHGYLDDVMFLGFGIEDKRPAGIDVRVSDLLEHLGLCAEANGVTVNPPQVLDTAVAAPAVQADASTGGMSPAGDDSSVFVAPDMN